MKKVYLSFCCLVVIFIISSCDDCRDCGPYKSNSYSMLNTTNNTIFISFYKKGRILYGGGGAYGSGDTGIDTFSIQSGETKELYSISVVGIGGVLYEPFSYYDSVHFVVDGLATYSFFKADSCRELKNNPLCEVNYPLVKKEEVKSGSTFLEYRIDIIE